MIFCDINRTGGKGRTAINGILPSDIAMIASRIGAVSSSMIRDAIERRLAAK